MKQTHVCFIKMVEVWVSFFCQISECNCISFKTIKYLSNTSAM